MGIDENPGTEGVFQPFGKASFHNSPVNKAELMPGGNPQGLLEETQAMIYGELTEIPTGIDQFGGMQFKIARTQRGEKLFHQGIQVRLQWQPAFLRNEQSSQREDRLGGIVEIQARVSRFIHLNEMLGGARLMQFHRVFQRSINPLAGSGNPFVFTSLPSPQSKPDFSKITSDRFCHIVVAPFIRLTRVVATSS